MLDPSSIFICTATCSASPVPTLRSWVRKRHRSASSYEYCQGSGRGGKHVKLAGEGPRLQDGLIGIVAKACLTGSKSSRIQSARCRKMNFGSRKDSESGSWTVDRRQQFERRAGEVVGHDLERHACGCRGCEWTASTIRAVLCRAVRGDWSDALTCMCLSRRFAR